MTPAQLAAGRELCSSLGKGAAQANPKAQTMTGRVNPMQRLPELVLPQRPAWILASRWRFARLGAAGLCDARSRTDEGVLLARRNNAIHASLSRLHHARTISRLLHVPLTHRSPDGLPPECTRLVFNRFLSLSSCRLGPKTSATTETRNRQRTEPLSLASFPRSAHAAIIVSHRYYARDEIERNVQKCGPAKLKQHAQLAICRSGVTTSISFRWWDCGD
jgi:hypothetical protein